MAFMKGSAYQDTPLFEPADPATKPFRGLRARRLRRPIALLEHTVESKQRLDSLAHEYYSESRDWRWLLEANTEVLFPEDLLQTDTEAESADELPFGHVILIPQRLERD